MKRFELIACEAVKTELIEGLEMSVKNMEYTLFSGIEGKGMRSRKEGTQVWPELNFMLVCYLDDEGLAAARAVIDAVSRQFPNEGIFAAASESERIK